MDYEEFLWATGGNPDLIRTISNKYIAIGESTNRKLIRDFRIFMAVGGMPQAVEAYVNNKNFDFIDSIKQGIINLYLEDLKKIDGSGRLSDIYKSVPIKMALK